MFIPRNRIRHYLKQENSLGSNPLKFVLRYLCSFQLSPDGKIAGLMAGVGFLWGLMAPTDVFRSESAVLFIVVIVHFRFSSFIYINCRAFHINLIYIKLASIYVFEFALYFVWKMFVFWIQVQKPLFGFIVNVTDLKFIYCE